MRERPTYVYCLFCDDPVGDYTRCNKLEDASCENCYSSFCRLFHWARLVDIDTLDVCRRLDELNQKQWTEDLGI